MAKKHVMSYYKQIQDLYFEMLEDVKDFDEALKGGYVTEEQVEQSQMMLDKTKDHYERLSYIILLLNQPTRDKKLNRHKSQNKKLYNYFENTSQDRVLSEIQDDLKKFKEYIKKEKTKWELKTL